MNGTKIVIDLDKFFCENYCNLEKYCKEKNIQLDELNDIYIKLKTNVILPTGMTAIEYTQYIKKSLWNRMLDNNKSYRKRMTVNYDDIGCLTENPNWIEVALFKIEDDNDDRLLYMEQIEYLTRMLFKFIEAKEFTDYEIFIFKSYFLVPKMTYKKLHNELGIDMMKIQRTIRNFKSEIKNNFIKWLRENEQRRNPDSNEIT